MTTYAGNDVGKTHCWWRSSGAVAMEIIMEVPGKAEVCPAIPLLGILPKDSISYYRATYSSVFVTALFIRAKK